MNRMWTPWTVFQNMENEDDIKSTDMKDKMTVIPNSDFTYTIDDKTNIQRISLFDGASNAIHFERQFSVNWICNYNMGWYPFDSQRCTFEMFYAEKSITANPVSVKYLGPKELPQHIVNDVEICAFTFKNRSGAIVEVILDRPLFGTILTVFMPTGILVMLSQIVQVFHRDYMHMVIAVNLTLLLVQTTL